MNIRQWIKRAFFFVLPAAAATACVEPYEFKAARAGEQLVIDGQFTTSDVEHTVKIRQVSDFGDGPGLPLADAVLTLRDDAGLAETYLPVEPGLWQLPAQVKGEAGRAYWLEVQLSDGRFYQSTPQKMPEAVHADSISFEFGMRERLNEHSIVVIDNVIDVFIDSPIPQNAETSYLRWTVEEAYSFTDLACGGLDLARACYFTNIRTSPQNVAIFSNAGSTASRVSHRKIATKLFSSRNLEFKEKHYFNVVQYTLSEDAYRFWEQAADIVDRSGSIFDSPPAAVKSNLYNPDDPDEQVLGLFEVAATDTIRRYLTRAQIQPFFGNMSYCPDNIASGYPGSVAPECCYCGVLAGAGLEKPHYWE